jgi:hypothetical protein
LERARISDVAKEMFASRLVRFLGVRSHCRHSYMQMARTFCRPCAKPCGNAAVDLGVTNKLARIGANAQERAGL